MLVITSAIDNHLLYGSLLELDEPSPRRNASATETRGFPITFDFEAIWWRHPIPESEIR